MRLVDSEAIRAFGVRFLQAYGASPENAQVITGHLVGNAPI